MDSSFKYVPLPLAFSLVRASDTSAFRFVHRQYADMRWGIQTESANNHSEVATCLKEIELCKKYSVATNFVVRSCESISDGSRSSESLGSAGSSLWFSAHSSADSS